jgi:hypothetical protein
MEDYLLLLVPAALAALLTYLHLETRNGYWHRAYDGTMERFKNGKWESRPMSCDEIEAWQDEQW